MHFRFSFLAGSTYENALRYSVLVIHNRETASETTVLRAEQPRLARLAAERGLHCSANHWGCAALLCDSLLALRDDVTAAPAERVPQATNAAVRYSGVMTSVSSL